MQSKRSFEYSAKYQRAKSRGFAMISVVALAPVLLTVLMVFGAMAYILRERTRLSSICTSHLYRMQNEVALKLNQLIKLNRKAKSLRAQMRRAEHQFYAALSTGNQVAILRAEQKIHQILMKQVALDAEQKTLIQSANLLANTATVRLKSKMRKNNVLLQSSHLAVIADRPADLAPIYRTENNLRERQKATANYTFEMPKIFEKYMHRFQDFCSVSIEKRNTQYKATLVGIK